MRTNSERPALAFIGTGLMGLPMARNLIDAGYPVYLWNRTRSKAEPLAGGTAVVTDTPEAAMQHADIVICMLENGPVVDQVLYARQSFRAAPKGALFIDMGSIPPSTARHHAQLLRDAGYTYLDAPVSGGTRGAEAATLSIMAGGDKVDFERALPVLNTLGTPHHIGPTGSGQLAKLANQAIVGITIGAVSEALLLAEAGGADPKAVRAALGGGFAGSAILEQHGQRIIERNFEPGARARVQLKDLNTVIDSAAELDLRLPLTERVQELYQSMIDSGLEGVDHSGLFLLLEAINGRHTSGGKD